MTYSISGKTVFITGGARGIGAETARRLASKGARVALAGLEPEELENVAAQCGPDAIWFETDVTDWDALERAVSGTVERFGGIDVVLANAGIATGGLVRSTDPAAWERVIEVNLLGVWRTVRTCLPHVIERRGYILPVASLAAAAHAPVLSAYAASKAGVEAFADSLRAEVAHHGVAVGVAYFSWIATEMVSGADATPASGMMRGRMRGPLAKTYPVSAAVDAIENGIESAPGACSPPAGSSCCWRCATSSRSSSNETWPRPCPRWSARSTRTSPPGAPPRRLPLAPVGRPTPGRGNYGVRKYGVRRKSARNSLRSVLPYFRTSRASAPTRP